MKPLYFISKLMAACLLLAAVGFAADTDLPLIEGERAVASVNGEPITLEEVNRMIGASHAERTGSKKAGKVDYSVFLERIVNMRLLVLEGRNMGLDQLPEVKDAVDKNAKKTLMTVLMERYLKDVAADEEDVRRIYGEMARQWRIKAVKIKNEADAKNVEAMIRGGESFEAAAKKAVEQGIAEGGEEEYLSDKDLTPAIARLVSGMETGSTSPIVSLGNRGYIIFELLGTRLPETEDAKAMAAARREALNQKRVRVGKAYYEELKKRYVKIDEKLFESLDYEAETPGLGKLLEDQRVLVEVAGEEPITVARFSKSLEDTFYHGMEIARDSKKLNKKKRTVLESVLQKRVLQKEARAQGIDKSRVYKDRIREYESSLIFGAFIQKVVTPEINVGGDDLKKHYQENSREFMTPEMMRIKSLVFEKKGDAVEAVEKLAKGTDFNWLSSHADGQVDKNTKGLLKLEGELLILTSLPEDLQKIVAGAKPGDFRLYSRPEGHYALYVYHVVAPQLRPFEDVRDDIAKEVFNEKVKNAIAAWSARLKEYYPVTIYRKDLKK